MKDKSNQQDKDTKEGPNLQVAGPGGEITAGITMCHVKNWQHTLNPALDHLMILKFVHPFWPLGMKQQFS